MSVATFTPAPSRKFSQNPIASVVQTLGVNNRKLTESISKGGADLARLVFAGFAVIPIVILLRFIS